MTAVKETKNEATTKTVSDTSNAPSSSEQQLNTARAHIYTSIMNDYSKLIQALKSLPLNQESLIYAYGYLDTGMLWVKEVLAYAAFLVDPKTETETSESLVTTDQLSEENSKENAA